MNIWRSVTHNFTIKAFSVAVAFIFWFVLAAEKERVTKFSAPIHVANIPLGLAIAGDVPRHVDVTLTAPGILLLRNQLHMNSITLDLRDTGQGSVTFPELEKYLNLPSGVHVTRIYPSSIELTLKPK